MQSEIYKEEMNSLNKQEQIQKSNEIFKLGPFYDSNDCVIRVGGRLQNSNLPEETKHQVILLHGNLVVEMKIQHC